MTKSWDPFAPTTSAAIPEASPAESLGLSNNDEGGGQQPDDGLELLRRTELIQIAQQGGLASYGTKDELIVRIRNHRATSG